MKDPQTLEELVEKICREKSDQDIILIIDYWKEAPFPSMFDFSKIGCTTWFENTEKYFQKYLKKFGRTNISL